MKKVEYSGTIKDFVERYDKVSHLIWNETKGEIVEVRKHIRNHYLVQQHYCCAYCRIEKKESHGMTWDVEHILPKSLFPEFLFEPENLAIACKECNGPKDNINILSEPSKKQKQLPKTSGEYTIVHPHFDIYSDHFEVTIIKSRRIYRLRNGNKAKATYIACNLSRFDYQYAEWDDFDEALVSDFSEFLDRCPKDATAQEIQKMLGHLRFVKKTNF
ncbi:HNH endonuclease [Dechloromonas sp. ZY10]|uniref:HNH endonuclease n=1 Tax=Dechloromonas aquae TaxID=2664436 RepID=UPI00352837F3